MLTPVAIMVVEQLPEHNTGALVKEVSEFVFDDAAIIACSCGSGIFHGHDRYRLGMTHRGHHLPQQLEEWGVQGEVRFQRHQNPLGSGRIG